MRVAYPARPLPVEALRGVDLEIPRGALFVLLGPNGAGKTTLMRGITGLTRTSGGSISVLGSPPPEPGSGNRQALRRLGVLIENPGIYGRLNAREYLSFFGSFYAVADLPARIRDLCARFGLEHGSLPVRKLSQGNRQKLQLIRSLLHAPEFLLWDEPTDHLDPEAQREVLGYLRSYLEETGAAALVATHRLEQMEAPATHFGFLRRGRMAKYGTREEILRTDRPARARVRFAGKVEPEAWSQAASECGLAMEKEGAGAEETRVLVSGPDLAARLPRIVKALCDRNLQVAFVEPIRASLPEVYSEIMEGPET